MDKETKEFIKELGTALGIGLAVVLLIIGIIILFFRFPILIIVFVALVLSFFIGMSICEALKIGMFKDK